MSERMTSIQLPGTGDNGFAEWGRRTRPEMIELHRRRAAFDLVTAQAILDAPDEAFTVETYRGVNVRTNVEAVL